MVKPSRQPTADDWNRAMALKLERVRMRIPQQTLAVTIGISRGMVAHYENCTQVMSDETYKRFVAALEELAPGRPIPPSKRRMVRR